MVYDCFPFFNELDLLKVRLQLLSPVVDRFVVVEATTNQQGLAKPCWFEEHKKDFEPWIDRIIHIKVDDAPKLKFHNDWSIEFFQRNCILRALTKCQPDDLIMISDVDEIPNPKILQNLSDYSLSLINKKQGIVQSIKQFFRIFGTHAFLLRGKHTLSEALEYISVSLEQDMFYYFMNLRAKNNGKWYGTVLCKYKNLSMPQKLRDFRNLQPYIKNNVGWHFSYLGGIEKIKLKLRSIIESDNFRVPENFSSEDEYINFCLDTGRSLFEKTGSQYEYIKPDEIGINQINQIMENYPIFFRLKEKIYN